MVDYGRRRGYGRRWSLILLVILMHGVGPRIATAQEDHEHEEPSETHHRGLHFSHPLFTESVTPDTKVRLDFGRVWEDEENESGVEFEAEYGLHRSFSILALIRYVFLDAEAEPSVSSLGSVEIALKFANFAFEQAGVLLGYGGCRRGMTRLWSAALTSGSSSRSSTSDSSMADWSSSASRSSGFPSIKRKGRRSRRSSSTTSPRCITLRRGFRDWWN